MTHREKKAPDEAGVVFRDGAGGDAAPIRMAECPGERGAEAVVAVAGTTDAEEKVHGAERLARRSEIFRRRVQAKKRPPFERTAAARFIGLNRR